MLVSMYDSWPIILYTYYFLPLPLPSYPWGCLKNKHKQTNKEQNKTKQKRVGVRGGGGCCNSSKKTCCKLIDWDSKIRFRHMIEVIVMYILLTWL